jgi:hypothetical protein
MTAFALNPTHGSEPHPLAGTLPVSRAILYATLVVVPQRFMTITLIDEHCGLSPGGQSLASAAPV